MSSFIGDEVAKIKKSLKMHEEKTVEKYKIFYEKCGETIREKMCKIVRSEIESVLKSHKKRVSFRNSKDFSCSNSFFRQSPDCGSFFMAMSDVLKNDIDKKTIKNTSFHTIESMHYRFKNITSSKGAYEYSLDVWHGMAKSDSVFEKCGVTFDITE